RETAPAPTGCHPALPTRQGPSRREAMIMTRSTRSHRHRRRAVAVTTLARMAAMITMLLGFDLTAAQAQLARTFVAAANGNDGANCDRLTPCRTFQRAHDNTLANGEITVLDAGGYGTVAITKALSIINDGVGEAGVLVSGGFTGIAIAAGADEPVSLRGLTVKGIGFGGGNGIEF